MQHVLTVLMAAALAASAGKGPNIVASTGYSIPTFDTVAPGQVITLFVRGLTVPDAKAETLPLPTTLSGLTVRVSSDIKGYPDRLPIFSVRSYDFCAGRFATQCPLTYVTVQMPTEPTCVPSGGPNECTLGGPPMISLTVEQNGVPGQVFPVFVSQVQPHFITTCDTIFGIGGICYDSLTHADGQRVTSENPARPGETIIIYAVGLGPTTPTIRTGEVAPQAVPVVITPYLVLSYRMDLPPASPAPPVVWLPVGKWIEPDYAGLVQGYVGLYQINVKLPDRVPEGTWLCQGPGEGSGNARLSIGAGSFTKISETDSVMFCIAP